MAIQLGDKGIDVSKYQVFTSYADVANSGVNFGYVKATEGSAAGTAYVSSVMDAEFNGLRSVGIEAGFYHFARYVNVQDALEEADWFISHIKNYPFTLPPALDLEFNGCGSATLLAQATKAFLDKVEQELGSVIIYLSASYYNMVSGVIGNRGIWLADPSSSINIAKSQAELFAWQNNWHGSIAGIGGEVDLDVACGAFQLVHNPLIPVAIPLAPVTVAPVVAPVAPPVASAPVVAPAPKPAPAPAPVAPAVPSTYTVRSGDSLSAIAVRFGIAQSTLQNLNGITDANMIYVGQILKLKASAVVPAKPTAPSQAVTYTVKSGDSLSAIAVRFGVSMATLKALNGISNENLIRIGQVLVIHPAAGPVAVYVTVQSGDSVSYFATKYGSTEAEIKAWNNLASVNNIYIGQRLRVK